MAVVCFSSLKGGVGKTTLALSVSHAFAERGCQTLLIDLDPAEHATNFFQPSCRRRTGTSPLAQLFLSNQLETESRSSGSIVEAAMSCRVPMITPVRPRFALLPGGAELRHFMWGKGARAFKRYFPKLLEELNCSYDYVVIDTAPDFNIITRNSIALSDLVVVPVDPSLMSINCLEQLVASCSHIEGPGWAIIRTMVNRQASAIQRLSLERMHENLALCSSDADEDDEELAVFFDEQDFPGRAELSFGEGRQHSLLKRKETAERQSPIFLLNSIVYRTEQQNKLSFLGKTAFDSKATAKLSDQYSLVARELEQILSMNEETESLMPVDDFMPQLVTRAAS